LVICVLLLSAAGRAGEWPAFRGPRGDGVALDEQPPLHWKVDENIRWRVPVPGTGNGSPIVVDGRVFLNAAQDLGQRRTLHCFDADDGRALWQQTVEVGAIEFTHIDNPYCGSTPASNGEVVVTWHGTGGLHCYTMDGRPLWDRDFGEIRHLWGYGTSPVIDGERVYVHSGACPNIFIAAVRLSDGELLWKTAEPGGQSNETPDGDLTGSWCTPVLVDAGGRRQLICAMPTAAVSYDPESGDVLWRCEGLATNRGKLVYASPLVANDLAVFMAGYMGPAMAVRLDGTGDVTASHRVWYVEKRNPQRVGSGVVVGDFIYLGNADGGTIQCLELATGKERWRQRVRGGPHWASTVYAGGRLYATNQSGITRVFAPNPQRFELLSENTLDETVHATLAVSNGRLFIRTEENLYCIHDGESDDALTER
jgi:outer membrane protein assembly factor BamB